MNGGSLLSRMPYRPTERTEQRKAEARERIVRAALDQLADGGYASASIQTVAARAGVATARCTATSNPSPNSSPRPSAVRHSAKWTSSSTPRPTTAASASERIAAATEAFARRALSAPTRAYALIAEPVDPAVEARAL